MAPPLHRNVAFSGKKKKDQLQHKRALKTSHDSQDERETMKDSGRSAWTLTEQPPISGREHNRNVNRFKLQFYQESKKNIAQMKLEGFEAYNLITDKEREIDADCFNGYDFPVRPHWTYDMSKKTLNRNENRYFREYVDELIKIQRKKNRELSLFELNLETWRQLWRVLEISDILLIIVDVRFATLMFPPSLYKHITGTLKKHAILVLNKVDLVTAEAVVAWREYFHKTYPDLPIVLFASYPAKSLKGTARGRVGHKRSMEGVQSIYRQCKKIVQGEVDLANWEEKILEDMHTENFELEKSTISSEPLQDAVSASEQNQPHVMYRNGVLTIGCVGFPNVGKSSLINALKGRKVVSVSQTPGHTKYFQTIFITNTVRLCDCPGLVFPSSTPKPLQILLGSFPIAQVQVPYSSLRLMAEHLNLPQLLKLQLPEDFDEWSSIAVAEAWAFKRGFLTKKAARPDYYRAANHLLRMCLSGQNQLILQFYPVNFFEEREKWQNHADIAEVKKYQSNESDDREGTDDASSVNSESFESDESDSSNDETNADEEEEAEELASVKAENAFALLEDD